MNKKNSCETVSYFFDVSEWVNGLGDSLRYKTKDWMTKKNDIMNEYSDVLQAASIFKFWIKTLK